MRRKDMSKPISLRAAAVLAILLLAGCVTSGEPVRDANIQPTPLHEAAQSGDVTAIRALLAAGADVNARAKYGVMPLHLATASGRAAIIILLAGGAVVNAKDDDGSTPLHYAAPFGKMASIQALLAAGADVNARAKYGTAPLHQAAARKMILAALEADAKGGRDKLLKAFSVSLDTLGETDRKIAVATLKSSISDSADRIRALLVGGANVNARADGEVTPLHYTAMSGDAAAVKALLDAGGDPNAVAFGCSPMDMARHRMQSTEMSIAPSRGSIEALQAADGRPREGCEI